MKKNTPIVHEPIYLMSTPVYLYDMSIESIEERAARRIKFNSVVDAAKFLMQPSKNLVKPLKSGPNKKFYCYHRTIRTKYAIRRAKATI